MAEKKTKYAGTQTEKNLEAAFAGESQAWMKYSFYADKARKDGYDRIAEIFEERKKKGVVPRPARRGLFKRYTENASSAMEGGTY